MHTENESKQNHERTGSTKPQEKKRQGIRELNVNRCNSHIKRHCLVNWIKEEDQTICCLQETHLIDRNKHWLKMKG
jgi:hypothetical protein